MNFSHATTKWADRSGRPYSRQPNLETVTREDWPDAPKGWVFDTASICRRPDWEWLSDMSGSLAVATDAFAPSPTEQTDVLDVLEAMPADQRAAIELRVVAGLRLQDVGDHVGIGHRQASKRFVESSLRTLRQGLVA